MHLKIIAFGKLKVTGLRESANYYQRLLRPWVKIEEIELKPISVPDKSPQTRIRIQTQETQILLSKLPSRSSGTQRIVLLDESGKSWDTQKWASTLLEWENTSVQNAVFCIGSSLGWSPEIRKLADTCVSFGPQTFSHELARVVLSEQLFRAWSVLRGHPYHNEG